MTDVPVVCPGCDQVVDDRPDLDHVAVDLAMAGHRAVAQRLNHAERVEAIRLGVARGFSHDAIARRLGMSRRSVDRQVIRAREQGLLPESKPRPGVEKRPVCPACGNRLLGDRMSCRRMSCPAGPQSRAVAA